MSKRGKFFVIEGGDGTGKATQTKAIADELRDEGIEVYTVSFPQYGQPSAAIIEKYLNGEFGEASSIAPELASAAYALDRASAKPQLTQWLIDHPDGVMIADRYVLSNLAHQGARITNQQKRHNFYDMILALEYDSLQLPKPDGNAILLAPVDVAQSNVDKKSARSYTDAKRDILERDSNHLSLATQNYRELTELFPSFTTAIEVYDYSAQNMRSIDDIKAEIRTAFGV